jgi:hypothetical protein
LDKAKLETDSILRFEERKVFFSMPIVLLRPWHLKPRSAKAADASLTMRSKPPSIVATIEPLFYKVIFFRENTLQRKSKPLEDIYDKS